MATKSSRIFVGNLPHEVTRDEIVKMFRKYGIVESVEMKTKQDTNTGSVLATFCYVNLDTDHDSLENCILLLNGIKCGERHIKVEIAKESFLQRLQRERQSSLKTPGSQPALAVLAAPTDTIKYSKSSKSGEKVSSKITKSKIELQDEKSEVQNENKRSPANKEKSTSKKNTQFRKGHTSLSESSESDDSDEELEEFHPTSKLPMFKGIGSVIPRDSVITNQPLGCSSTHNHSQINKDTREKYEARMLPSKAKSGLDTSSSILKKFELFSDVWKDTDEPHSGGRKSQVYKNTNMSLQESDYNVPLTTTAAEEKRLKSLESRRQAFEQQKRAIQHALSDKTSSRINKKIVFSDDNSDACGALLAQTKAIFALENQVSDGSNKGKKKTLALFEESDEEATNDNWTGEFKVKKQFEGSKGKKLLDLQNSYNNDQRFKLDERFYESDDDSNVKSMPGSEREPDNAEEHIEGLAEEREQQLQILSSIIGRPIPVTNPPSQSESRTKGMLRFDPLKPSHLKYELSKEVKENKKKRKPKVSDLEKKEGEVEEDEELVKPKVRREEKEPEPVSQNKFYSVSETLAESLKLSKEGQSSGFSLLQMFGSPETLPEKDEQYSNVSTKKLELKRPPTLEDSFSCNDEANDVGSPSTIASNTVPQETSFRNGVFKSTGGVWQESLFFHSDDSRLKEGNEFFSSFDDSSDVKFAVKREALRHIVKRKIRNSSRKANSFKTKVGALHKKNSLWPKTVSKPQIRRRQRH